MATIASGGQVKGLGADRTVPQSVTPGVAARARTTEVAGEMDREAVARPIGERVDFGGIRYANCWEDASVLAEALAPLRGARALSIASAGDNSFSLLARGAARVLAVDLSPAQLALVALKRAAFLALDHDELLGFLGARPCPERLRLYARVREPLEADARRFWDARRADVARGVIHAGRLERYFRLFGRIVLPLVHSRATRDALFEPRSGEARARFVARRWDTPRWRLLFRVFFSRLLLGRLGRDPAFFDHVEGPVGARLLQRTNAALARLDAGTNPYLFYALCGRYGPALPDYLRPEHHAAIRAAAERLVPWLGSLEEVIAELPAASLDAVNLSDVPEYMTEPAWHALLRGVVAACAPGARIAWWTLLAARGTPADLATRLSSEGERASELHARAGAFFYGRLALETVRSASPEQPARLSHARSQSAAPSRSLGA
jgi:S-adenosylmethionine-diacylglycerol 3-amino-3-carboxypropyl transferase